MHSVHLKMAQIEQSVAKLCTNNSVLNITFPAFFFFFWGGGSFTSSIRDTSHITVKKKKKVEFFISCTVTLSIDFILW